jgi:tetratricopeptide (TPR) repeat protein
MASPSPKQKSKEPRPRKAKQPFSPRKILLQTCLAGVVITLITGGALAALIKYSGRTLFSPRPAAEEGVFSRKLRDYDRAAENLPVTDAVRSVESLIRLLDDLEKSALGVESRLSVLKRRRALAAGYAVHADSASARGAGRSWSGSDMALASYRASAVRAAAFFPHSGALASVAAEAVTRSALRENAGAALSRVIPGGARQYAAIMGEDTRFAPAALGVYVLSGDMADPELALAIPGGEALLQAAAEHRRFRGRESLILDAAILAVLKNDVPGALERIMPLLEQPAEGGSAGTALRFGAELLYDFGDPLRAAALFARFGDDRSIARRADSLVLAGQKDAARSLWTVLAAPALPPPSSGGVSADRDIRIRSLYNLAAGTDEEAAALERLLALDREHLFGVIRYTRLLPAPRAVAILEDSALPDREALADLELLRRRRESWSIDRTVPETWLLINRHPQAEALYQWAGYYFVFQRRYSEVPPLLRAAERNGFTGSWLDLQRALEHIRQGRLDEAEGILKAAVGASWEIHANLGRLLEAKRSYTAALENYERAAAPVREKPDAAKLQLRIARCLRALGRERESLRVLEYAQTLDGGNLNIRLERERVEQSLY